MFNMAEFLSPQKGHGLFTFTVSLSQPTALQVCQSAPSHLFFYPTWVKPAWYKDSILKHIWRLAVDSCVTTVMPLGHPQTLLCALLFPIILYLFMLVTQISLICFPATFCPSGYKNTSDTFSFGCSMAVSLCLPTFPNVVAQKLLLSSTRWK